jgi:hypothetical protein
MSALKFLTVLPTGIQRLVSALTASTGVTDANKVIATNATGKIDLSFFPAGVEVSVENILTDEALSSGDFVNIYDNGGVRTVRKANAAAATPRAAHGFVLSGSAIGTTAVVYTVGENDQLSGLVPGDRYFLSASTAGAVTSTPSILTAGNLFQLMGFATSATSLRFEFDSPIEIG